MKEHIDIFITPNPVLGGSTVQSITLNISCHNTNFIQALGECFFTPPCSKLNVTAIAHSTCVGILPLMPEIDCALDYGESEQ
jgi:hypothetical protein